MEEGDIIICLLFFIFLIVCDILTCILVKFHSSILFINRNILTYLNLTAVITASLVVHFQVIFVFVWFDPSLYSRIIIFFKFGGRVVRPKIKTVELLLSGKDYLHSEGSLFMSLPSILGKQIV